MGAEFSMLFSTRAELEGAVSALNSLEMMRGKMVALGQDTEKIDSQLAHVKGSLQSFGQSGAENAKMLESAMGQHAGEGGTLDMLHHHARAINMEMRLLGVQMPEIGHLLHLAFSPEMLGIAAASMAVGELVKGIVEARHAAKELADTIRSAMLPGMRGPLAGSKEMAIELNKELVEMHASVDALYRKHNELSEVYKRQSETMTEQRNKMAEIAKMAEEAAARETERKIAAGEITREEAAREKFQQTLAAAERARNQELAEARAKIVSAQSELSEVTPELGPSKRRAEQAQKSLDDFKNSIENRKENIKRIKKLFGLGDGEGSAEGEKAAKTAEEALLEKFREVAGKVEGTPGLEGAGGMTARELHDLAHGREYGPIESLRLAEMARLRTQADAQEAKRRAIGQQLRPLEEEDVAARKELPSREKAADVDKGKYTKANEDFIRLGDEVNKLNDAFETLRAKVKREGESTAAEALKEFAKSVPWIADLEDIAQKRGLGPRYAQQHPELVAKETSVGAQLKAIGFDANAIENRLSAAQGDPAKIAAIVSQVTSQAAMAQKTREVAEIQSRRLNQPGFAATPEQASETREVVQYLRKSGMSDSEIINALSKANDNVDVMIGLLRREAQRSQAQGVQLRNPNGASG